MFRALQIEETRTKIVLFHRTSLHAKQAQSCCETGKTRLTFSEYLHSSVILKVFNLSQLIHLVGGNRVGKTSQTNSDLYSSLFQI